MIRSVVMLTPEAPYPLRGGGSYRTASLLHYFARFAEVDLILISESGEPAPLPAGLVRSQTVLRLPVHHKSLAARYRRNAGRLLRGVTPLVDRMSGLEIPLAHALEKRVWDLGVVEHFWCAPYGGQLRAVCDRTLLDLHNVESSLHRRCAAVERGLVAAGHRRFARLYEKLEARLLPEYSTVLATSQPDMDEVKRIAPGARVEVFANSLPEVALPSVKEHRVVVFSGNFEYHPNIDAVKYLANQIWPALKAAHPELRLRLVGRGESCVRHLIPRDSDIEFTGPVGDAFSEIAAAQVVVAPLRAGSGTRVKILEAWAAGRAIVATPLAAEGLNTRSGENLVLAEGSEELVRAIDRLLDNPLERLRLGANGRRVFEREYTWRAAWQALDASLEMAGCAALNRYTE